MPNGVEPMRPAHRRFVSVAAVIRVTAVLVALLAAGRAHADDPWLVSLEGGASRIHEGDLRSGCAALRLSRSLGASPFRLQAGASVASAGALDLGLEWRALPRARVTPFVGVGGGVLAEEERTGSFWRGTVGLEARLATHAVARVSVQAGTHDGQAGPHQAMFGFGWRF